MYRRFNSDVRIVPHIKEIKCYLAVCGQHCHKITKKMTLFL